MFLYRPGQAVRLQEVEAPRISRQLAHEDSKDVNLCTGRLYPPPPPTGDTLGTHLLISVRS